jgi:hypothetical protein
MDHISHKQIQIKKNGEPQTLDFSHTLISVTTSCHDKQGHVKHSELRETHYSDTCL